MKFRILGKEYDIPLSGEDQEWFDSLDYDERVEHLANYLQDVYPETFGKMPAIDTSSGSAVDPETGRYNESVQAQLQWAKDNPEAYKFYRLGSRRAYGEGASLGFAGEAESAVRSIGQGNIPWIGEGFKENYTKQLEDIELSQKLFDKIYPMRSLGANISGGFTTGAGYGVALSAAVKSAPKAWDLLTRLQKLGRFTKRTATGAGVGYGTIGAYRYGTGEGGTLSGDALPGSDMERFEQAFLDPRSAAIGAGLGVGAPLFLQGVGKVAGSIKNYSPMFKGETEDLIGLENVTGALREDALALKARGLGSEVDAATGLPLDAMRRGRDTRFSTIVEGTTAPGVVRGQDPDLGPVTVPLEMSRREAGWAVKEEPALAAADVATLTARTEQSTNRLVDDLYDLSLGAERAPQNLLDRFTSSVSKLYDRAYGVAYKLNPMPAGGRISETGKLTQLPRDSFRDLLIRSSKTKDKLLAKAYNNSKDLIDNMNEAGEIIHGVIPNRLPTLDEFLTTGGQTIDVIQAHMISKQAGLAIRAMRNDPKLLASLDKDLLAVNEGWIQKWTNAVGRHSTSFPKAQKAFRTEVVLTDALEAGRNFRNYRDSDELLAALRDLKAPEGISNKAEVEKWIEKIFISGAIDDAKLAMAPSTLLHTQEGTAVLDKLTPLLGKGKIDELKMALRREEDMTTFATQVGSISGGETARQQLARGPGAEAQLAHDIPMFYFSKMFFVGRKAEKIGRDLAKLENQAIAGKIQSLLLSTDNRAKQAAVKEIYDYARSTMNAKDRSIMNSIIRTGTTAPEERRGLIQ